MVIREMSREECLRVLAGERLARLACSHENQPYVVPVYLAYHQPPGGDAYLYGFTTPGQKIAWMRTNPLVCVEVDQVAAYNQWLSVIVFGRYEELPETPAIDGARQAPERPRLVAEAMPAWSGDNRHRQSGDEGGDDERLQAWNVLKTQPEWWQPGSTVWAARAHRDSAEPFISVYYRIRIDRVTGHEASRDATDATCYTAPARQPDDVANPDARFWRQVKRGLLGRLSCAPRV